MNHKQVKEWIKKHKLESFLIIVALLWMFQTQLPIQSETQSIASVAGFASLGISGKIIGALVLAAIVLLGVSGGGWVLLGVGVLILIPTIAVTVWASNHVTIVVVGIFMLMLLKYSK